MNSLLNPKVNLKEKKKSQNFLSKMELGENLVKLFDEKGNFIQSYSDRVSHQNQGQTPSSLFPNSVSFLQLHINIERKGSYQQSKNDSIANSLGFKSERIGGMRIDGTADQKNLTKKMQIFSRVNYFQSNYFYREFLILMCSLNVRMLQAPRLSLPENSSQHILISSLIRETQSINQLNAQWANDIFIRQHP